MSFETAMAAIERCAEGPNCGIIFFGGEPLLCKSLIWTVIRECDTRHPGRFHYKVTTNGTLLDDAFLDESDRRDLHIALSHDGVREVHDTFRVTSAGAGSFDAAQTALARLIKRRPYSPVMMTVNPETVASFAKSVQFLQSQQVQYVIASLNYAGAWTDAAMAKLRKEYLKLAAWHEENYRQERKFYFSPFDKRIASRIFPDRGNSCRLGKRQISVAPDGTLYPCVQFVGREEYRLGTVTDGIDETRRESIFQCNEQDKPTCRNCALERRCHNKCGCLNIQTTGRLNSIPAALCENERMVFPIIDQLAERLFRSRDTMFIQRHYNPAFPILSFLEDLSTS
jgi:uncharacterized protein